MSVRVTFNNDRTSGAPGEPTTINVDIKTDSKDVGVASLASNGGKPVLATSVSQTQENVVVTVTGNGKTYTVSGNGTPVKLQDDGSKVDVSNFTIKASKK